MAQRCIFTQCHGNFLEAIATKCVVDWLFVVQDDLSQLHAKVEGRFEGEEG